MLRLKVHCNGEKFLAVVTEDTNATKLLSRLQLQLCDHPSFNGDVMTFDQLSIQTGDGSTYQMVGDRPIINYIAESDKIILSSSSSPPIPLSSQESQQNQSMANAIGNVSHSYKDALLVESEKKSDREASQRPSQQPSPTPHQMQSIAISNLLQRPTITYTYQRCQSKVESPVIASNILTEYLSTDIVDIVFEFCDFGIAASQLLQNNGWAEDKSVIYDVPKIWVENVKAIVDQPSVILTIGAPGSGKTTWALERCHKSAVFAADDFFDLFNKGEFDRSQIGNAHQWCQKQVYEAMRKGETVVVSNTNTTLEEMNAYVTAATFGNFPHKIVFAVMPEQSVQTLCGRGLHGVARSHTKNMVRRMTGWLRRQPPSVMAVLRKGPFPKRRDATMSKDFLYCGIFLDKSTMDMLRQRFREQSHCALLSKIAHGHCTVAFQPTHVEIARLPFGNRVQMRVVAYANHPLMQCYVVDILDPQLSAMCRNEIPHITMAFDDRLRPVYSNDLLQFGAVTPIATLNSVPLIVEGVVGAFSTQTKDIVVNS